MRNQALLCALLLLMSTACWGSQSNQSNDQTDGTEVDTGRTVVAALYVHATWYAGRTDYYFETEDGQTSITVGVSNFEDEPGPEVPDNMLEPEPGGIPGENPALVGKSFEIAFDANSRVVSITLVGQ